MRLDPPLKFLVQAFNGIGCSYRFPLAFGETREGEQSISRFFQAIGDDGQKVLLAIKNMGGESEAAWRALLDNLVARGLKTPELVIVDGSSGLDKALAALWSDVPVQRCTVHKHRNLLAHAPDRLHEEVSADYNDMIYAKTKQEIEAKRKVFIRKWRLKCHAAAHAKRHQQRDRGRLLVKTHAHDCAIKN